MFLTYLVDAFLVMGVISVTAYIMIEWINQR